VRLRVLLEQLGAGDVGRHQVRCELDAVEGQIQHIRKCLDQQCLRQAGDTLQQYMSAAQYGDEQALYDILLSDDDLTDLIIQFRLAMVQAFNQFYVIHVSP